jgi:hypothetical protein
MQEETIAVIHGYRRDVIVVEEVKVAAGDSARHRGACEEERAIEYEVAVAEESLDAKREEVGAKKASGVDDGAPVLADTA